MNLEVLQQIVCRRRFRITKNEIFNALNQTCIVFERKNEKNEDENHIVSSN